MANFNKIIVIAVLAAAFFALTGVASAGHAPSPTITIETIQTNGNYVGTPKLLSSEGSHIVYEYLFVPDGTYTIFGTITNPAVGLPLNVDILAVSDIDHADGEFAVPAASERMNGDIKAGKARFSLTLRATSVDEIEIEGEGNVDVTGVDYVDEPDTTAHTLDYGPMSDTVAIFSNGKLTYNGLPQYFVSLY